MAVVQGGELFDQQPPDLDLIDGAQDFRRHCPAQDNGCLAPGLAPPRVGIEMATPFSEITSVFPTLRQHTLNCKALDGLSRLGNLGRA
jgi:hypothetical protein